MRPNDPFKPVATTGDMADQLVKTRAAFKVCMAQLDAIEQWKQAVLAVFKTEATSEETD